MFLPFSKKGKLWEPKGMELRRRARCGPSDLLDPWTLAPEVGLQLVEADKTLLDALPEECRLHLLGEGGKRWAGGVLPMPLPDGKKICILNPANSIGRKKSTLMEEIAHAYLGHKPTKLLIDAEQLRARDYDDTQEGEAYGVGVAALLPWHLFFHDVNNGLTRSDMAEKYQVTEDLIRYRIQITGAFALYRARQRVA